MGPDVLRLLVATAPNTARHGVRGGAACACATSPVIQAVVTCALAGSAPARPAAASSSSVLALHLAIPQAIEFALPTNLNGGMNPLRLQTAPYLNRV